MTSSIIPVIDVTPLRKGTAQQRQHAVAAVRTACETIGFLLISGHGIAPEIIDGAFRTAFDFFDLALADKQQAVPHMSGQQRGYAPFASKGLAATLGQEAPPDLRESFFLGPLEDHRDHYAHIPEATVAYRDNIWPVQPRNFQSHFSAY
ncbi:MAG: hypothetical protein ETSY1_13880 [Candidatus Entotheonella factor]|uniref:Non-haem dioxygenase N-terminal domain-containing protein n=1 Tax=Entotheonella factor TaxID=1429438 RepID=W4LPE2_ENTF1|nr:2-oxoglutarate and iron-dependent oxygenase domain-containing protein [Candidatus Entotheonella palauensis]ETW99739.1 MAG: hypothetical protein ETSY1_13880 [Candidatus Entotheonella factor]